MESARRRDSATAHDASTRAALIVFVAALAAAFPLYVVRGRDQWFFYDDWDFLASRSLTSLNDLFRPHNVHWSTLPIVVYRVLWQLVGLRSYVPYQVVLIALHLVAAVLLRTVMRRAGVGPWVATAAASLFVFLGAGRQNIVWAFQIGFVASLVCGLAHLLLSDHDGPLTRRDWYGLGLGLVGLLCSGVAVTMTMVVGIAVFVRRGWRAAAFHTLPLAVVYGVWYLSVGRDAYTRSHGSLGDIVGFFATGISNAFARMGQVFGLGVALAIVLVIGLALAWSRLSREELRQRAPVPSALLLGAVIFLAIAGYGRGDLGSGFARASRYVHLVAAMTLPAIAVAVDALVRRWKLLAPIGFALLLVGIPGNIRAITPSGPERFTRGNKGLMLALARSPLAAQVSPSLRPLPASASEVTIDWLLDGVHSGRVPKPADLTGDNAALATLILAVRQTADRLPPSDCSTVTTPVTRRVSQGDRLTFDGPLLVNLADHPTRDAAVRYLTAAGNALRIDAGTHVLLLRPAPPAPSVVVCASS